MYFSHQCFYLQFLACEGPPPRRVKEVPTKSWDKPPYPHGTLAIYNCRPGYVKAGRVGFRCIDGVWKELSPGTECRNKPCGHPGDTDFGFFELTSGTEFVFGARVEYRCNDGYQMLSQRNYRECQADGWSNDIPHCEVIKCLPVQEPENGRIIMTGAFELGQEYSFGQVVNFECNAKYKLVGAKEIVCSANGEWSSDVPQCKEINCDVPEIPHGYVRSPRKSYKENELMQFFCEEGYKYGNKADALCTASGWNPPPYCTEIVCSPPVISSGNFRPQKDKYMVGNTIAVECDDGYHFKAITGRSTAECTKNGWVPEPACVRKPCEYPPIENGKLSYAHEYHRNYYFPKRFGQTVDYYCLDGYSTPTGRYWVRITCTERGWFPEPKCLKICFTEQLAGGYFPYRHNDYFKEGDRVRYTCHSDFQAQHNEVTCTRNGWAPPPRCTRKKKCQDIIFENGYLNSDRRTFNLKEKIPYVCHTGFVTPEGQESGHTQCKESGWTPPPKCIKSCKAPEDILIHHTNKTVFMPEDTIEYSCLEGYRTTNNMPTDTTTCGKNGEWSPEPECHGEYFCVLLSSEHRLGLLISVSVKGCGAPPEIRSGRIVDGSAEQYQHGARKQYECNSEFKLVGSKEIECIDGQWSSPPSCIAEKNVCPPPPQVPGTQQTTAGRNFRIGSKAFFSCPVGFQLVGTKDITCIDGKWQSPPHCLENTDVPRLENPNLRIEREGKTMYLAGARLKYVCRSGYMLNGPTERSCSMGNWTAAPSCLEMPCGSVPKVANAQFEGRKKESYEPGETVRYQCDPGFQIVGSPEIFCRKGNWTSPSTSPFCKDVSCGAACGTPPAIQSGELLLFPLQEYQEGDSVEYKCPNFYILEGSPTITCRNGQWTDPPVCLVACTASEEDMARNNIELKWVGQAKLYSTSGDFIEFRCKQGYLKHPNSPNFRVQCVEGTLNYPWCTLGSKSSPLAFAALLLHF
uniref:Uncharacterized protein n=1 Tax=Geospiza parvula TaxID=87175 RepID=A0A8C3NBT9_GEOPR